MVAKQEAPPPLDGALPSQERTDGQRSAWGLTLRSITENRLAVLGLAIIGFFVVFCWIGPHIYHTNQSAVGFDTNLPPSAAHPLGTDASGFDELGRLMVGGQAALEIGFAAALIAIVIGTLWGAVAGVAGGIAGGALMRIVDALLSIPALFIVLIVATRYSASVISLSVIIGIFSWLVPARLVRAEVLSLRTRDFVAAATVMGASRWRLIVKHLIPNTFGVVIVNVTFQIADAILAVAALGFLGFGLHYPRVSWGDMLSNGVDYLLDGYWWEIYPVGACLILVVMACNFIGDGLRDAVDARLRRQ
jgi:peptide/nickel transport system permease protein